MLSRTENQFIAHRVPVKDHVKAGENTLLLTFLSAFRKVCATCSLRQTGLIGSCRDENSRRNMAS